MNNFIREVSEDHTYDTIEFNEFLQMMSKQMNKQLTPKDLIEAFRQLFCVFFFFPNNFSQFRIFDKNNTGMVGLHEVVRLITKMGIKMKRSIIIFWIDDCDDFTISPQ